MRRRPSIQARPTLQSSRRCNPTASQTAMAGHVHTSRAALNRLLRENDTWLTLDIFSRSAQALGYRIKVKLVEA